MPLHRPTPPARAGRPPCWALLVATLLVACGSGGGPDTLSVGSAWARPTPPGAANGVVYFELVSPEDDTLVGVTVPATIAASATLHRTTGTDAGGHDHHGGDEPATLGMEPVTELALVAGETLTLAPGGNHLMLEGLATTLALGDRFVVTLELAGAGAVPVEVVVADNPPED